MKKRVISIILVATLLSGGCGAAGAPSTDETYDDNNSVDAQNSDISGKSTDLSNKDKGGFSDNFTGEASEDGMVKKNLAPSLLGGEETIYYDQNLVPSVEKYTIADDFSNVVYDEYFSYFFDSSEMAEYDNNADERREMLIKNGFVVDDGVLWDEFFDVYESNRYMMFPSFVTVDSLMHTYHLYFGYLMRKTEKNFIAEELKTLSGYMLKKSKEQYEEVKGTDWEEAVLRNVVFFYVGSKLQDDGVQFPIDDKDSEAIAETEFSRILEAKGIDTCGLNGLYEDYTQYKPRGYYDGDEKLEKYFRAMMWYGRIPFELKEAELVKSASLITLALNDDSSAWESIYSITSFFAGASDDTVYTEIIPALENSYGKIPSVDELRGDSKAFEALLGELAKIEPPQINSVPVDEGDDPVIASFRFMGQRFTIDAAIMQRLIYSSVGENESGEKRYFPDVLDTEAVLGSEKAYELLEESGATEFENYTENYEELKNTFSNSDNSVWNESLYSGWLNTLRPLLEKKGEGYPLFMQNEEWVKKDMETFAGSYAELKHDTILYAKQVMAEMGGGGEEEVLDDRGYVEPEPIVYSRFIFLSDKTKTGLESYGMLDDESKEDLDKLTEIAKNLLSISEKELKNEALDDADYDFIREYGGYLEHFWLEAMQDKNEEALTYSYQAPCPIVADIATDPNGEVLEVGTGKCNDIFVVFPIEGELHVGRGSVYSFYQFTVPLSERLTDDEWRKMLDGGYIDDNWNWVESEERPDQPEWTQSYRIGQR